MPEKNSNPPQKSRSAVYGIHAVEALVRERGIYENDELYLCRNDKRVSYIVNKARKNGARMERVSQSAMTAKAGSDRHQGVLLVFDGALRPPELTKEDLQQPGIFVAAENIQDPQNLGAIIRTMEAFGARGLILPRHDSAPLSETVLKVSAGAMLKVPVLFTGKMAAFLNQLEDKDITIIGTSLDGEILTPRTARQAGGQSPTILLVLGSEQKGLAPLTKKRCHYLLRIEQFGNVQSLNVSASAAIFLYQFSSVLRSGDE